MANDDMADQLAARRHHSRQFAKMISMFLNRLPLKSHPYLAAHIITVLCIYWRHSWLIT